MGITAVGSDEPGAIGESHTARLVRRGDDDESPLEGRTLEEAAEQ